MTDKGYESHLARCPFYHREGSYMVQCDGWLRHQTLCVTFDNKADAAEQKETFCRAPNEDYKACPLYEFICNFLTEG